jgi:hypothetical protein
MHCKSSMDNFFYGVRETYILRIANHCGAKPEIYVEK